jgi:ApaG protein
MYSAVTRSIQVTVTPAFHEDQSNAERSRWFWSYKVEIVNNSGSRVQLLSRYWHIRDANGKVQEVRGEGVVGKQPRIDAGATFEYTSGCPLETPGGIMSGHYVMQSAEGETFRVTIPAFSLDVPETVRVLH